MPSPTTLFTPISRPPDDTHFNRLWGLHNTGQNVNGTNGTDDADIDAPEAWDITTGSSEVVVAVVDSGVDCQSSRSGRQHLDQSRRNSPETASMTTATATLMTSTDGIFIKNDNAPATPGGHGTHVAGTIAAVGDNAAGIAGVSWSAKIMALRFIDAWGMGNNADAIAAIEYANEHGRRHNQQQLGRRRLTVQSLKDAIDASDALVVCAAGNSGKKHRQPCPTIRPVTAVPTLFQWRPATRMTRWRIFQTTGRSQWMWLRRAPTFTALNPGARRFGKMILKTTISPTGPAAAPMTAGAQPLRNPIPAPIH